MKLCRSDAHSIGNPPAAALLRLTQVIEVPSNTNGVFGGGVKSTKQQGSKSNTDKRAHDDSTGEIQKV